MKLYYLPILVMAVISVGCATDQPIEPIIRHTRETLREPEIVTSPLEAMLREFRLLVAAYSPPETLLHSIVIELDYMPNRSGVTEKLPSDILPVVERAFTALGAPFKTCRHYGSIAGATSTGALTVHEQQVAIPHDFKLRGNLDGYIAERVVQGDDGRADARGTVEGREFDVQVQGERKVTISSARIYLQLADANGLSLPGGSATYQIQIEESEGKRAASIYVSGSGIGGGTGLKWTQDIGDALYDATAACLVHLLGSAFLIPYYRTHKLFAYDQDLEERFLDGLDHATEAELEVNLKRYMFAAGHDVDLDVAELTVAERTAARREFGMRNLSERDRLWQAALIADLWRSLDYRTGAERVKRRGVALARASAPVSRQPESAARAPADSHAALGPADFGWEASMPFLVLDLTRVDEHATRVRFLELAQGCPSCMEIRTITDSSLYGMNFVGTPAELQRTFRKAPDLADFEYQWLDETSRRLLVLPHAGSAPSDSASSERGR